MVKSLRAFRKPGAINLAKSDLEDDDDSDAGDDSIVFSDQKPCPKGYRRSTKTFKCKKFQGGGGSEDDMFIFGLVILLAAGGFWMWKKKKKG